MPTLFDSIRFGDIHAANRIAMAPLTRDRAGPGQTPTPLMATYYGQRASAGLVITEATQISPGGQGYLDTPGLHSAEQIEGWKRVTAAVHEQGGRIVVQLWHVGRISHVSLLPPGEVPVSSSARPANAKTYTKAGFEQVSNARALRTDEIPGIVDDYRRAARNALAAGFDGVEVHAANGYLIEQFIRDSLNDRTDVYGGSTENRIRFATEVMAAVVDEIGAGRTGIRLSPVTPANDAGPDSDPETTYGLLVDRLATLQIAYLHIVEGSTGGKRDHAAFDFERLRARFKNRNAQGAWIVNNGYDRALAISAVENDRADLVAFGKPFISNPDLVERLRADAPLAAPDEATFYGGGAKGYIDYPTLMATVA